MRPGAREVQNGVALSYPRVLALSQCFSLSGAFGLAGVQVSPSKVARPRVLAGGFLHIIKVIRTSKNLRKPETASTRSGANADAKPENGAAHFLTFLTLPRARTW
jgi:hypothetical protein